ncbi:hypothetical protein CWO90_20275 [Bradyrhizobium sp. Leo121]|nr:hypothetical protein CWO90_20275 [Bradyrhizobium sp. Leo121]
MVHHATRNGDGSLKAILVSTDGDRDNAVWLPAAVVELNSGDEFGKANITLPERMAIDKELI